MTDAGWRKEVSVEVWIWPPELGKPKITPDFDLKRRAVKLEKNCKIKYRGRVNPETNRAHNKALQLTAR